MPFTVKEDVFLGKATMDDLIALKLLRRRTVHAAMRHTDADTAAILPAIISSDAPLLPDTLCAFARTAQGAVITPPRRIFFLLAESYGQVHFDAPYAPLGLMEAGERFRADEHTVCIDNFLSGGMISQPSLTSLLAGVYDADL